jgi:hypothetical protein
VSITTKVVSSNLALGEEYSIQHYVVNFVSDYIIDSIDSARKRYRKEVLANCNKTRINTGHKYDLLVELKQAMKVQTHAQV